MTPFKAKCLGRTLGLAAFFLAAAIGWGCTKDPPQQPRDAAGDAPGLDQGVGRSDALIDRKIDVPPDAQSTPPANVRFPDPPQVTCAMTSDCEFPPSACADPGCDAASCPGLAWVVYYDHPQCTSGRCVFEQRYFRCMGGEACSGGGCIFNGTAAP